MASMMPRQALQLNTILEQHCMQDFVAQVMLAMQHLWNGLATVRRLQPLQVVAWN